MMEFLLSGEGYPLDLNYGQCLFTGLGSRPSPESFSAALDWAERFFQLWPDHLVREIAT
jgi:hypothetical protein